MGGRGQRGEGGGIGIDNEIVGVWKEIERKGAGDYYEVIKCERKIKGGTGT